MTAAMHDLASDLTLYAARLVRLLRREREQPAGLRVLSLLDEHGASSIGRLAAADQCSQPTMTGLVHGLVERGWVRKQPDPADARSTSVSVTAAGRRVLDEARAANGALVVDRLVAAGRGADDLATAVAVLRAVLDPEGRPDDHAGHSHRPDHGGHAAHHHDKEVPPQ